MDKKAISREVNQANLAYFCNILEGVEHFAFFGTMLGLEREGALIEGDDDIDFYVPAKERLQLIARLAEHGIRIESREWPNNTPYFLQARRLIGGIEVLADFYLFEDTGYGVLKDRWNFHGQVAYPDMALHVPSDLVYPLKKREFFGNQVNMPHDARALCKFLYGPKWQQKLEKGTAYITMIWRNKPLVLVGRSTKIRYRLIKFLKKTRRFVVSVFSD
jgi:hypothetical protein